MNNSPRPPARNVVTEDGYLGFLKVRDEDTYSLLHYIPYGKDRGEAKLIAGSYKNNENEPHYNLGVEWQPARDIGLGNIEVSSKHHSHYRNNGAISEKDYSEGLKLKVASQREIDAARAGRPWKNGRSPSSSSISSDNLSVTVTSSSSR